MKNIFTITVALFVSLSTFGQNISGELNEITDGSIIVGIVFTMVFIAQIFGLSLLLPRFLMKKIITCGASSSIDEYLFYRYSLMNNGALIIGIFVLSIISFHPIFSSEIPILIAIGLFFLLQLVPIAFNRKLFVQSDTPVHKVQDSITLSKVIHPLVVSIAVFLFSSYLIVCFIAWNGSMSTQLLQMAIFIVTNFYLVFMIVITFRKANMSTGDEKMKHIDKLLKMTPLFIYISIGISVYYYGKMLLFGFQLYEYRPIMMSAAFMLLGVLIYNQLSSNKLSQII